MTWPTAQLAEVLTPVHRSESPVAGKSYRQIGVRLWGEGAYERESIDGSETKYAQLFRTEAGDVIVNKIWARNGSVAVVPESLAGCFGSGEFPMFASKRTRLDPHWMHWLTKTPTFWANCDIKSRGTSGKNRIRPERFLEIQIPLPSVPEQKALIARIQELAAQVHEARKLRLLAAEDTEALIPQATSSRLDDAGWATSPLGEILAEKPRNGLGPQQEVDSGGRPMLRINAVSSSPTRYVDMTAVKQVQVTDEVAQQFVIRSDDVFVVRYNGDINRVAKPGIYRGANEARVVYPDKLIRLRPNAAKMTPDFLVFALRARSVRTQIEKLGKTTAGNIGVSGGDAQSFIVPVPPLPEQRRIVAELDTLQADIDAVKRLQAETAAELDALLPSVLDRAFRGEL